MRNEASVVHGLELACSRAYREESLTYRALTRPKAFPAGVYLACWSFFPLLLETHRSLLRRIRVVLDEHPIQPQQRVISILIESVNHVAMVHEAYAIQFQAATQATKQHTVQPDVLELLNRPLTALDAYKRCLHALHATDIPASLTAIALLDGGAKEAFESMRLRHSEQLDIETKVRHVDWTRRVLVDVTESVQFADETDKFVESKAFLFDGVLVAQSASDGSILVVLEDTSPITIVPFDVSTKTVVVLGSVATCHATFSSQEACAAWLSALDKCFETRRQSTLSFDLHALFASMQQFPKSWLVADTETANHDLVASAAMWLVDPRHSMIPRLHQMYLMKDMVLYGRIHTLSECRFVGYILGEHIHIHDPPLADQHCQLNRPFEVEVAQEDGDALRLLVAPVDMTVRMDWIAHFHRLRDSLVVPTSDESEDLFAASPSIATSHTTMATSSEQLKTLSSSASVDKEGSSDSIAVPTSKPLPAARMLQLNNLVGSPATSETEIDSGDDVARAADSLDSMLCAKNTNMQSFTRIQSPQILDKQDEPAPLDDTFCAETPDAKDDERERPHVLPTSGRRTTGDDHSPPSKRAIKFISESVDDTVRSTVSRIPSTQDMESGTIQFLTTTRQLSTPVTEVPASPEAKSTKRGRPKKKRKSATPTAAANAVAEPNHSTPKAPSTKSKSTSKPLVDLPPSTQEMEGGAIQFLRDVPFACAAEPQRSAATAISRIRIALTGIQHAEYEDDVTHATHVIAPSGVLKRTVKILCGISCCSHILDEKWLHESAKLGHAAPEESFCLSDPVKEQLWGCSLHATMYNYTLAQRQSLLRGRAFYVTRHKTVLPPPEDLERIIACAGGEVHGMSEIGPNTLVITSVDAAAAATVQKVLKRVDPTQCYTPELLLRCILTQSLALTEYHVALPDKHDKKPRGSRKKN
ncbi:hypothetical protein DYB32_009252 [Aphanomyces invadans]|uniref:BRCT domain-containing protein n=1 Tax=Aphanomyces invadans TaxID=157072 RepID=A0A3R6V5Z4_9STRA|nr:hypothetical protein DYB32_009252 [Aphanomyces invadans]